MNTQEILDIIYDTGWRHGTMVSECDICEFHYDCNICGDVSVDHTVQAIAEKVKEFLNETA